MNFNGVADHSAPEDIYSWLRGFINLERGPGGNPGEHFKLDRMEALAELAGRPERCAPVIHAAGSKGKGSLCAMISAILTAAGKKCGRYLSPHVSDWRERICLDGEFLSGDAYAGAGEELRGIYRRFKDSPGGLGEPTFFELMTLYFFLCARRERCDVMVVETGLGGRLDATNIVDPLVSLISAIELEHTEYLGATIEEVAAEKAGIIKEGRPVIIAAQEPAVLAVLRKRAGEKAAPLYYLPEEVEILNTKVDRGGTSFLLREPGEALGRPPGSPGKRRENRGKFLPPPAENPDGGLPCRVPMPGAVQGRNAALAAAAARLAFPETDGDAIRRGLERTALPARFERLRCPVPFIVDGAHTPASVSLCVESFRALYGGGGILLFGCAAGKDDAAMSELLVSHFKVILITSPGSFRASSPERAYGAFLKAAGSSGGPSIKLIRETGPAIARALELAAAKQLPVLGTGSFYLAAEIRDRLGSAPPPAIP